MEPSLLDISMLIGFVVILDISSNKFPGVIPDDISNCSLLNTVKLNNNNLQGPIPSEIGSLHQLRTFSVAWASATFCE